MKKRILSLLLGICMVATMFVGCGSGEQMSIVTPPTTSEKGTENTEKPIEESTETTEEETTVTTLVEPYVTKRMLNPYDAVIQYVRGGTLASGSSNPEFADFMNSDAASEGVKALEFMKKEYNYLPGYKNGSIECETLAYAVSSDGETFKSIQLGDSYELSKGTQLACLYQYTLVGTEIAQLDPIIVSVIVVLECDDCWEFAGCYSTDQMSKYLPIYNAEN